MPARTFQLAEGAMANGTSAVRTRKNVLTLSGANDDLFWYRKAVAELQKRPITDVTSWRFQAAVHGYDPSSDPSHTPSSKLPPSGHPNKVLGSGSSFNGTADTSPALRQSSRQLS
jgi:hypothetical protein